MTHRRDETIIGYKVYADSLADLAVDVVSGFRDRGERRRWLACINPHSYSVARSNGQFRTALRSADWLIPDGSGIVLASRLLGGRIQERVTGPDLFRAVSAEANRRGPFSVLFVGSTPTTLATIAHRYAQDYPNVGPVATHSPPFRPIFSEADIEVIRALVNRQAPDLLWLGLTAPKQELLLQAMHDSTQFGFAAAIGAAFDFYAGNIRRSPRFFRDNHLEWLPRLLQEPTRLWRRTFISAPVFLWDLARHGRAERPHSGGLT